MNTSKLLTERAYNEHMSKLLTAVDLSMWESNSPMPKDAQFGFRVKVATPTLALENSSPFNEHGFDIEFTVPFDDDIVDNESEISIYNLTDSTINKFKVGDSITITAGFGEDMGVIFEGHISKVKTSRNGLDKKTTIYALDGVKHNSDMKYEKTYSEGVTAQTILKDLLNRVGMEIVGFEPKRNHTYDSEVKIEGSVMENIKKYSEICGVSTYIHKQKIYSRPITSGDNLNFEIKSDTGMIDSPEPYEEESSSENYVDTITGYNIKMILQHRISTAAMVNVESLDYKGKYRVASGKHTFDGLTAMTEIKTIDTIKTTVKEDKEEKEKKEKEEKEKKEKEEKKKS